MEEERFAPTSDHALSRRTDPWWGVHASRYAFGAAMLPPGGAVLDVACGSGYGLAVLAPGRRVIGVDVDREALASAANSGVPVIAGLGEALPFATGAFDAATSFETIEHLEHREEFVAELARVIRPGGWLVLSTPNARYTQPGPDGPTNPYHLHEYEPEALHALLLTQFEQVTMQGQTLSARFRISPFYDDQRRLPRSPGVQARLLTWKVVNKLPLEARTLLSRALLRRPEFYPGETDYDFREDSASDAPVLVVTARRR